MGTNDVELEAKDKVEPLDLVDDGITGDISNLNVVAGQANSRSLRLIGKIDSHTFKVLIDSSSTHNFIKPVLANDGGWPFILLPIFKCILATVTSWCVNNYVLK